MTATQERAEAAMRAIGDTVTGAPPLRLPPQPLPAPAAVARSLRFIRPAGQVRGGHAWRPWLVPAAAAAAVVALAVSLVLVRSVPKQSATPSGTSTSATLGTGGSAGVPPYYVTLPAFGWYAYAPATQHVTGAGLVIGETASGKRLAAVPPPHGMTFNVVTGAADDRTFVVGATSYSPAEKTVGTIWSETWYLLRISPGTTHVTQLTRLSVPAIQDVTGVALSPDGTELAVANQQYPATPSGSVPADLTVWSVAAGKVLRHWWEPAGHIAAAAPAAGSSPRPDDTNGMATALRWTPDGKQLGFAWNGAAIRLLDPSSPASRQTDLVKASTLSGYTIGTGGLMGVGSLTCDAAAGWSLSTGAATLTCAGSVTPATPATGPGCGKTAQAQPALIQEITLPGGAGETTTLAQAPGCEPGPRVKAASLGWTSADGTKAIAMLGDQAPRDDRFGVFTKKTFTALPAVLANGSLATVAW